MGSIAIQSPPLILASIVLESAEVQNFPKSKPGGVVRFHIETTAAFQKNSKVVNNDAPLQVSVSLTASGYPKPVNDDDTEEDLVFKATCTVVATFLPLTGIDEIPNEEAESYIPVIAPQIYMSVRQHMIYLLKAMEINIRVPERFILEGS